MKLTLNINEPNKIASFLNMIKEMDYVEIIDVTEDMGEFPLEHREILNKRLKKIESGESAFNNWESFKKKYEGNAI